MNPISLFENLRDMYLRYLDSPFDLRYEDLTAERRSLLDQDGRIYRPPLIEPVPAYRTSGESFGQAAQALLGGVWQASEIAEVSAFVDQGLFPPTLTLHQHQRDAFEEVVVNGRDVVVTTGTGSGKTECFLLPVVASIARESAAWSAPGQRTHQWDWWNHFTMQRTRRRWAQRLGQRAHETRTAAVRALLLYPLNALVEDQLTRLREALDSPGARSWLQANRHGNLVYFGRYTGRTPVSGGPQFIKHHATSGRAKEHPSGRASCGGERRRTFLSEHRRSRDVVPLGHARHPSGHPHHELLDAQHHVDASVETSIFDQTRQWLEQSPEHVFHLVVDELHTYRGTPGTEVAYLLRALLDRLGLAPDSEQLRIISSSASLESGTTGLQYLEQFFGRDRDRFRVIGGPTYVVPPNPGAAAALAAHAGAFAQFAQDVSTASAALPQATASLHAAVGAPALPGGWSAEETLNAALQHVEAPDALRLGCTPNQQIVPQTPAVLLPVLFPGAPQAPLATDGLLTALSHARNDAGLAPIPMRVHLMFRNLQGLWVCTDPGCGQAPQRSSPCPAGILHYVPTLTCQCGARVLELLYCEACGEVFFGGYRRDAGNPNEWYLSPDHPNLEAAPDFALFDRDYERYGVFWPATGALVPGSAQWTQDGVRRAWRAAYLDPVDGRVGVGGAPQGARSGYLYYVPQVHGQNPPAGGVGREAYPARCPRCDADWAKRTVIRSPVRTQRTGFQKIAQVLSDGLLRDLAQPPFSTERKLVVFSDSRQDAAKLSAGMRFSHYRDALRQALMEALGQQAAGPPAFAAQCQGHALSPDQQHAAATFQSEHPQDATIIAMAANPAAAASPSGGNPALTNQQAAQRILQRAANGPFRMTQIAADASARLLAEGMNPAGCGKDALWTDPQNRRDSWPGLYDWPPGRQPGAKPQGQLSQPQRDHLRRIHGGSVVELMDIFFASGRRSMESLLLALPTTDRITSPAASNLIQEGADGAIRLLGSRKRLSTHPSSSRNSVPGYVAVYLTAVAQHNGLAPPAISTT